MTVEALPELRKGGRLVHWKTGHELTVRAVMEGSEFDEPVYKLEGRYTAKLKGNYTGEDLAKLGYIVVE